MDGQGIHADRHTLGRDDGELLAVRAVFVQLVDHLAADRARSSACELDDLLGVRGIRVYGAELAPAVAEEDDQVIRLTFFQLLQNRHKALFLDMEKHDIASKHHDE